MSKLLLGLLFAFAVNAAPVYADEALPEIAAVDEPALPPLTIDTSVDVQ